MISSKSKSILITSGRTGSSLIIQSLINNGYNVASEPLNFGIQDYPEYVLYKMDYIKNISDLDKVNIIDNILKKYDLCKILYYQLDMAYTKELCSKYNTILLLRNPFDTYISFKIAECIKRWHNTGQDRVIPDERIYIDPQNMIDHTISYFHYGLNYIPYASKVITYNDLNNSWIGNIEYFLKILNQEFKLIGKPFRKNPEVPSDFIDNYEELKSIYNAFYPRLV